MKECNYCQAIINTDIDNYFTCLDNFIQTKYFDVNNDGNYEPKNCRWITIQEQQKNKKRKIKADLVVKVEE